MVSNIFAKWYTFDIVQIIVEVHVLCMVELSLKFFKENMWAILFGEGGGLRKVANRFFLNSSLYLKIFSAKQFQENF